MPRVVALTFALIILLLDATLLQAEVAGESWAETMRNVREPIARADYATAIFRLEAAYAQTEKEATLFKTRSTTETPNQQAEWLSVFQTRAIIPLLLMGKLEIKRQLPLKALERAKRAEKVALESFGDQSGYLVEILSTTAQAYMLQKQLVQAEETFRRALAIAKKVRGAQDLEVAEILTHLARIYYQTNRADIAQPVVERAVSIYESRKDSEIAATALGQIKQEFVAGFPELASDR